MKSYRVSLLSAVLVGLTMLGMADDANASRRKAKPGLIQGRIQLLESTFVILNNTRVELTPRTVYQDRMDAPISLAAFAVNDCVKVKLITGRTSPTAREMEQDDNCTAPTPSRNTRNTRNTRSPGVDSDDNGGQRNEGVSDDSQGDDCSGDDNGRGRGRGRGRGGR
ncbi:MAG: hypothetical protein ACK5GN_04715 [Pseudomonadota bacterium]|jgi:hypothetical protein